MSNVENCCSHFKRSYAFNWLGYFRSGNVPELRQRQHEQREQRLESQEMAIWFATVGFAADKYCWCPTIKWIWRS